MRNNILKLRSENRRGGFALLIALLVITILLTVGMGIADTVRKETRISMTGRESQIAFYAADAGIECAYFWDMVHPDLEESAFASIASPQVINCNGGDIYPGTDGGKIWFDLNLGDKDPGDPCVRVYVQKTGNITTFEARGYNVGYNLGYSVDCGSTSLSKVERGIKLTVETE